MSIFGLFQEAMRAAGIEVSAEAEKSDLNGLAAAVADALNSEPGEAEL